MRYASNIMDVCALNPDYMGFIFYERSKRYVGEYFDIGTVNAIPKHIKKTGVFVNSSFQYITQKVQLYALDVVQLHGEEPPEMCAALKKLNVVVIKVFLLDPFFSFSKLKPYEHFCDYYLFDTKTTEYGGSGLCFDWNLLEHYTSNKPFFLSGGIDIHHLEKIKSIFPLPLHAVDVNSKFEISPGVKDVIKLKHFIAKLNT